MEFISSRLINGLRKGVRERREGGLEILKFLKQARAQRWGKGLDAALDRVAGVGLREHREVTLLQPLRAHLQRRGKSNNHPT